MIIIKTQSEIERLRKGGPILAAILRSVAAVVRPGVTTKSLDDLTYKLIVEAGCKPAFLNFTPDGASTPYPATLITSINDEVVHGIPSDRVLKDGEIISLDTGLKYDGVFLDHAVTVPVGNITKRDRELLAATEQALMKGIHVIKPGATTGDIGHAIESVAKRHNFSIAHGFSGHGVGRYIHEDPYVTNTGKPGKGEKLVPGMVIAIEPMFNLGRKDVFIASDGYTCQTSDGSRSAHFEHTVLITEDGAEILTR